MKLTDATFMLKWDGRVREATFHAAEKMGDQPVVAIAVADLDEAQRLLGALDPVGAPSKRKPRTTVKPSIKCIVPGCTFDADTFATADSDMCRNHHDATEEHKAAWRMEAKKPTPAPIARKRAKEIGEQLAGGDGAKASA